MLVNCPECNREVSDIAHACPNCGFPMESSRKAELRRDQTARASFDPGKALENVISKMESLFSNAATPHLWDLPGEDYASQPLPMKWYMFWTYFSMPVGTVIGLVFGLGLESPVLLVLAFFQGLAAWQMHLKTESGFILNALIVALTGVGAMMPNSAASSTDFFLKMLILTPFVALLWFYPNYKYWRRRKHLFGL